MLRVIFALSTLFNSLSIVFDVIAYYILTKLSPRFDDDKGIPFKITLQLELLITCIVFYTVAWLLLVPVNFVPYSRKAKVGYFFAYLAFIVTAVISIILAMDFSLSRDLYSSLYENHQYGETVALFSVAFVFNIFNIYLGMLTLSGNPFREMTVALP